MDTTVRIGTVLSSYSGVTYDITGYGTGTYLVSNL